MTHIQIRFGKRDKFGSQLQVRARIFGVTSLIVTSLRVTSY